MANELRVTVCFARQDEAWLRELLLPVGATVADALAASGFAQLFPGIDVWQAGVGIYGQRREAHTLLADGDRVEIYRALTFDPKESRRRRVAHRRNHIAASGGRVRPAGLL
ncbi:RnfH family protein [Bordetella avium]|uniref:RnfH family protein n=1 Tax=Bordetella avium TaxID=521 RepID=UPI000E689619|nr:RnfH family protein [Bordetella avium]AZY52489.1 RnfH family protein [Bordetella avium]RIQ72838.1 RnfH family protein [Bordetella avium]